MNQTQLYEPFLHWIKGPMAYLRGRYKKAQTLPPGPESSYPDYRPCG